MVRNEHWALVLAPRIGSFHPFSITLFWSNFSVKISKGSWLLGGGLLFSKLKPNPHFGSSTDFSMGGHWGDHVPLAISSIYLIIGSAVVSGWLRHFCSSFGWWKSRIAFLVRKWKLDNGCRMLKSALIIRIQKISRLLSQSFRSSSSRSRSNTMDGCVGSTAELLSFNDLTLSLLLFALFYTRFQRLNESSSAINLCELSAVSGEDN